MYVNGSCETESNLPFICSVNFDNPHPKNESSPSHDIVKNPQGSASRTLSPGIILLIESIDR